MKILLFSWSNTGEKNIMAEFKQMGHIVDKVSIAYENLDYDQGFSDKFINILDKGKYDFVFSYNYFPIISNDCEKTNIKYVSWIWDSPLLTLYSRTVSNPCNYIFVFDKALYYELNNKGVNQVYHMPLASNVEMEDDIVIREIDKQKYSSEISFVGDLYTEKNFYDKINFLPEYIKGYLDGIMRAQLKIYGYNFLEELLTDEIISELKRYVQFDLGDDYFASDAIVFANLFLGQKVTAMERVETLDILSRKYFVDLYTGSNTNILPKINNKGYIDYETEMPKVFKLSKINLNITLKTIKTGIPLRAFDIMGAGGFLLTSYQEELLDYFEPNKDFVFYEDFNDLENKINYYLSHEDERREIAHNGYIKVKEKHNIKIRLSQMLDIIYN